MASRRGWIIAAALILVAGPAIYWFFLARNAPSTGPEPPQIDLAGIDSGIAQAVRQARADVLHDSSSAAAWVKLGKVLIANRFWQESLTCFRQAEHLDRASASPARQTAVPLWLHYQALALISLEHRAEAVQKLREAVALLQGSRDKAAIARLWLAKVLLDMGDTDEARQEFRRVLEEDPGQGPAHFGLAQIAMEREEWRACREHLEACLKDPRVRRHACTQLPPVCLHLRDRDAAARYEQTAAGLPPDLAGHDPFSPLRLHPELALSRQSVLRQIMQLQASGKLQESVQMLVPLIEEYPDDFRPRIYLGRALIMAGKETDGEQQLRRAVQLAPDQFETQYTLAKYLAGKAEALWPATKERDRASRLFQESAQLARRALEIDAASGQAHVLLGVDLNYLGRREQALACFRQAVQCSPEASEPHLRLGIILAEQGKKTEAEFHLEQARRLNPGDPKPAAELKKLGKGP